MYKCRLNIIIKNYLKIQAEPILLAIDLVCTGVYYVLFYMVYSKDQFKIVI